MNIYTIAKDRYGTFGLFIHPEDNTEGRLVNRYKTRRRALEVARGLAEVDPKGGRIVNIKN